MTNFSLLIDCLIVTLIKLVKFLICPNLNQFCFELILTTLSVNKLHQVYTKMAQKPSNQSKKLFYLLFVD